MEEKKTSLNCSITDVKQSPMAIFDLAKQQEAGVYVYNRNRAVGVMVTVEQYKTLQQKAEKSTNPLNGQHQMEQKIREAIPFGTVLSARALDERLCALGFESRIDPETVSAEMIHELNESGKIDYLGQEMMKAGRILAEVIGEQSNQSNLPDKIIIKKIHLSLQ